MGISLESKHYRTICIRFTSFLLLLTHSEGVYTVLLFTFLQQNNFCLLPLPSRAIYLLREILDEKENERSAHFSKSLSFFPCLDWSLLHTSKTSWSMSAICSKSASLRPLEVMAGAPIRTPPGAMALTSPTTAFLFTVIWQISHAFSILLPVIPCTHVGPQKDTKAIISHLVTCTSQLGIYQLDFDDRPAKIRIINVWVKAWRRLLNQNRGGGDFSWEADLPLACSLEVFLCLEFGKWKWSFHWLLKNWHSWISDFVVFFFPCLRRIFGGLESGNIPQGEDPREQGGCLFHLSQFCAHIVSTSHPKLLNLLSPTCGRVFTSKLRVSSLKSKQFKNSLHTPKIWTSK